MNRKDIIIFAALVNVGLVLILFITANHGNQIIEKKDLAVSAVEEMAVKPNDIEFAKNKGPRTVSDEEMEAVINDMTSSSSSESEPISESEELLEIVVKQGDYLEKIANLNNVSVEDIIRVNELQTETLRIGQKLQLPLNKISAFESRDSKTIADVNFKYYIVKNGDNPWLIAIKHKMPLDSLLDLNDLDEASARQLRPGDRLRVQ